MKLQVPRCCCVLDRRSRNIDDIKTKDFIKCLSLLLCVCEGLYERGVWKIKCLSLLLVLYKHMHYALLSDSLQCICI